MNNQDKSKPHHHHHQIRKSKAKDETEKVKMEIIMTGPPRLASGRPNSHQTKTSRSREREPRRPSRTPRNGNKLSDMTSRYENYSRKGSRFCRTLPASLSSVLVLLLSLSLSLLLLCNNSNYSAGAASAAELNVIQHASACREQVRNNLQITNFTQIFFEPQEICASWAKMMRSQQATPSSSASNSQNDQHHQPWTSIEKLDLSANKLTVLHDSTGLGKLINLKELHISHNELLRCEESSLLGLKQLQMLDLSHNKLMALPAKIFQPIKANIKKLILSHNQISVLVPSLFDGLTVLEHLDLSHNEITSHWFNDLLFQNLSQLHYLDLSFNKLTIISSQATFSSLLQLETLSLQHNELRQVPETLQHLRKLSSLDLSQNMINDISNASYLSNCRQLFNLNLESNSIENVTRDAFIDLPELKVLNLASNKIQHLDQQAFEFVPDLHALRLDSNKLVDFGQSFVNLRLLLMLNVSNNRISSFDYAQIPLGLQWLDLHSNKIDKLNNYYYSPIAQQQFSMSNNNNDQSTIGQQWSSLLRLTTLDASFNLIKEIDNTSLPESLETVHLNNNQLKMISSHTFSSKSNLTRINLSNNLLTTMPFEALKLTPTTTSNSNRDMTSATTSTTSSTILHSNSKFLDIYLANNPFVCNCQMGWFSQLLLASAYLNPSINISNISNISNSNLATSFGSNLNNISNNNNNSRNYYFVISAESNPSSNQMLHLLREYQLILARQLPRIADARSVSCHLSFARQAGPYYSYSSLLAQNSDLNLPQSQQNQLWYPVLAASQLAMQNHQLHNNININNNHHNHHLTANYRATTTTTNSHSSMATPKGSLSPSASKLSGNAGGDSSILKQSELLASVHLCSYKSHCIALCNCCDFDACDCEMTCPENCSCYYAHAWSTNIVDCSATNQLNNNNANAIANTNTNQHHQHQSRLHSSNNNYLSSGNARSMIFGQQPQQLIKFTKIPDRIPMDVTDLYLDGLQLLQVKANALIGRNKLKTLYLNDSQIHSIERRAFAHQKSLRFLQLNSNQLERLVGYEFEEQSELRELYLANNRLSHLGNNTFTMLKSLQVLHLQNNQIYHFNFWSNLPSSNNINNKLMSIHLGHNPWSCQCDYVKPMLQWLHLNVKHLYDRKSITCQYNSTSSLHLLTSPSLSISHNNQLLLSSNTGNPVDELLDNMMMISNNNNNNVYDSLSDQNYAMFDASRCLNHTIFPSSVRSNLPPSLTFENDIGGPDQSGQIDNLMIISGANTPSTTNGNNNNNNFAPQTPNDDPFLFGPIADRSILEIKPAQPGQQLSPSAPPPPSAFHQQHGGASGQPSMSTNYPGGDLLSDSLANWNPRTGGAAAGSPRSTNNINNYNGGDNNNNISPSSFQLPASSNGRGQATSSMLDLSSNKQHHSTTSWLITFICVTLIAILIVISLIHYRRPMGQWFYTNYGALQLLPSSLSSSVVGSNHKSAAQHHLHHHHHHAHNLNHAHLQHHTLHPHDSLVINKQSQQHHNSTFASATTTTAAAAAQHQHLNQAASQYQFNNNHHQQLQYGISSAGSTSSSSAASTNLTSQALCYHQSANSSSSPNGGGLVTTPLIVSNTPSSQINGGQHHHHLLTASHQHHQATKQPNYVSNSKDEEEKLFDAYLTYSKFDEQLVNECIAPELECGQSSYRIALRHRDLPPQSSDFLSDCIIETANASRRIVLLLSESFLVNEWSQAQFRSAHLEALSLCEPRRLIVVLLSRPESLSSLLDAELARLLRTAATTIQYQDKTFWPRLQLAMQSNGNLENQQNHHQRLSATICVNGATSTSKNSTSGAQTSNRRPADSSSSSSGGGLFGKAGLFSGFLFNSGGGGSSASNQDNKSTKTNNASLMTSANSNWASSAGKSAASLRNNNQHQQLQQQQQHPLGPVSCFESQPPQLEQHHYAHLTPPIPGQNMISQSPHSTLAGSSANLYQQPIYADNSQQPQQQQHLATLGHPAQSDPAAAASSIHSRRLPVHI